MYVWSLKLIWDVCVCGGGGGGGGGVIHLLISKEEEEQVDEWEEDKFVAA